MGRKKKRINNSGIPQHEIEHIARCILPDILAYYESAEGQREFREWQAQREAERAERKEGKRSIRRKRRMATVHWTVAFYCSSSFYRKYKNGVSQIKGIHRNKTFPVHPHPYTSF